MANIWQRNCLRHDFNSIKDDGDDSSLQSPLAQLFAAK